MTRCRAFTFTAASTLAVVIYLVSAGSAFGATAGAGKLGLDDPVCASSVSLCTDSLGPLDGYYVGHDEPSLEFKSNIPGSGNDMTYLMTLPRDPATFQPTAFGGPGSTTWNFELRPTFWFGLTLCDTASAPEYTKTCTPDSDSNNLVGRTRTPRTTSASIRATRSWSCSSTARDTCPQFEGFGCTAHQYCAAMTIDSRTLNQNTGIENTAACNNYVLGGPEPVNWAYITKSGVSQAPANPLFTGTLANPNLSAVNPNLGKDLLMSPGDRILIHHAGHPGRDCRSILIDLTTGQSGSMTASVANGFGHILFTPNSQHLPRGARTRSTRSTRPPTSAREHLVRSHLQRRDVRRARALRELPGSSTRRSTARSPAARTRAAAGRGRRQHSASPAPTLSLVTHQRVLRPGRGLRQPVVLPDWPGTNPNPCDRPAAAPLTGAVHQPGSPTGGTTPTIAFETDLPAIEAPAAQANPPFCDRSPARTA